MWMTLDDSKEVPFYKQIVEQIQGLIRSQALVPGELLPSTRALAIRLNVHRSTVNQAYQELWALGEIDLEVGKRASVRMRLHEIVMGHNHPTSVVEPLQQDRSHMKALELDSRLYPTALFSKAMHQVFVNGQNHERDRYPVFSYSHPLGSSPLRRVIQNQLRQHQIHVTTGEIMISSGIQQALYLILSCHTKPITMAVETPTYKEIIPLLKRFEVKVIEIPMTLKGMDLSVLEDQIKVLKSPIDFVYTMPNFHNPTGITTNQAHREKLYDLCFKHQIILIEDGFEEEMKYFGKAVPPIKAIDKAGIVLYCGSYTKTLFPGIRLGFIVGAFSFIERLSAERRQIDMGGFPLVQEALAEFCNRGYYERHIAKLHRIYRQRMIIALKALKKHMPLSVTWEEPTGGYLIWVRLPDCKNWEERFKDAPIEVMMGDCFYYSPTKQDGTHVRLSIAALNGDEIESHVCQLAQVIRQYEQKKESKDKEVEYV